MNSSVASNENWGACPKCGEPVLIDPATGIAEPCAACMSHASPTGRALGTAWIVGGIALIVVLVVVCIEMLL
jgi:uncharacterized protein (DUF983 family)